MSGVGNLRAQFEQLATQSHSSSPSNLRSLQPAPPSPPQAPSRAYSPQPSVISSSVSYLQLSPNSKSSMRSASQFTASELKSPNAKSPPPPPPRRSSPKRDSPPSSSSSRDIEALLRRPPPPPPSNKTIVLKNENFNQSPLLTPSNSHSSLHVDTRTQNGSSLHEKNNVTSFLSTSPSKPPPPPKHPQSVTQSPSAITPTPSRISLRPCPPNTSSRISVYSPPPPPQRAGSLQPERLTGPSPRKSSSPPPLPGRPASTALTSSPPDMLSTSPSDRPTLTLTKSIPDAKGIPAPPKRTLALGDPLPPLRAPIEVDHSSDSSDDEPSQPMDSLPDATRASRLPPIATVYPAAASACAKIQVKHNEGRAIASGQYLVVLSHGHLRGYNLLQSDTPVWELSRKELCLHGSSKLLSMAFRPCTYDPGNFLWVGTSDGHLLEVDVRHGKLHGNRFNAHTSSITHIFRHGQAMLTVDDGGKVLVFEPAPNDPDDMTLWKTQPTVLRALADHDFAVFSGGWLWMSKRKDSSGESSVNHIRVYNPFERGNIAKTVFPTADVGMAMAATTMRSHPGVVFIGHEGGYVSIWATDPTPVCTSVVKLSAAVVSMVGVSDRLWIGERGGSIAVYDTTQSPWTITNLWVAHHKASTAFLDIDPFAIDKAGRLVVVSVGRDERVRLWDGLLAVDWIENELIKREKEYSTFRDINALLFSWNVDSQLPEALSSNANSMSLLSDVLSSMNTSEPPDIISFGFQEVVDLNNQRNIARDLIQGNHHNDADGGGTQLLDESQSSYKAWHDKLRSVVRMMFPADVTYQVVKTETLVGLFTVFMVRTSLIPRVREVAIKKMKRGFGGRTGNKGAIVTRLVLDNTSLCFVNCHLAAGQHKVRQRNSDISAIMERKDLFSIAPEDTFAFVGGGDGQMILDHETVFVSGDMNYRINVTREAAISAIQNGDFNLLWAHDQLHKELNNNPRFRLRSFQEGPLLFAPTYKYDRRSDTYDTSAKQRVPAWCDRILWRASKVDRVRQLSYRRYEVDIADHRPISASFAVTVKSVDPQKRAAQKEKLLRVWLEHQKRLLTSLREYYVQQALL